VVGIDLSRRAIDAAQHKASARGLTARFRVANALDLQTPDEPFDVVIDSGVFHSFDDADRPRYVDVLRRQLRDGGRCFLMCFSDRQPGDWGPRRVREDELEAAFADGWTLDLAPATFAINPFEGVHEVHAWLASLVRT
jgi:cyclopropane fatty-acyl-phospholipid synthase-like methyltransferase